MIWAKKHRLACLFAAATLVPIGALTWLGVRSLQQDRDVERQRQREGLEVAAGRLALDIERALQDIEHRLAGGAGIHFLPSSLKADPELLYQPTAQAEDNVQPLLLAEAEAEEFQRHNLSAAATAYQHLVQSSNPSARAAALVGLGRVLRQRNDRAGALEFKLLGLFARRAGRVLTRRVLIDDVWGRDTAITERVVDNQIANLRKKIEPSPAAPRYLKSVRGIGYRFDLEEVTES